MPDLKLIAMDAEDLAVLSAHLQDAVMRVEDMAYLRQEKRFAGIANRFDWEGAITSAKGKKTYARRRSGLRFERVLGAKVSGIDLKDTSAVLSLLAIDFAEQEKDNPAGLVTLQFSGGAAIRLAVECIEAELKDLGAAWETKNIPAHSAKAPAQPELKGRR